MGTPLLRKTEIDMAEGCYYTGIQYTEITNLAGSEVEGVWANIQCDKQHLALGVMYRPPSSNNAYLKSMLDQIDNVVSYN